MVIALIILVLALAMPGLSAIGLQSRFNAATQVINGALTRAYYSALADGSMTAVRFVPGEWDYNPKAQADRPPGRQHVATYSYVGTSAAVPNPSNPSDPGNFKFGEYFQRQEKTASLELPDDIWIAPVEALDNLNTAPTGFPGHGSNFGQYVLTGTRGAFTLDARAAGLDADMLKADDFAIVFDPQTGLRGGLPTRIPLKAYVPTPYPPDPSIQGTETDRRSDGLRFYRYSFSGIVIYRREAFVSLDEVTDNLPQRRQEWLRANGRPYLVHRFGGGLVMGTQYAQ